MSAYETVIHYYVRLQQAYGWTTAQIDETPIELLLDELLVIDKVENAPTLGFIEDILPM